jgi:hypothetical protein
MIWQPMRGRMSGGDKAAQEENAMKCASAFNNQYLQDEQVNRRNDDARCGEIGRRRALDISLIAIAGHQHTVIHSANGRAPEATTICRGWRLGTNRASVIRMCASVT